MDDICSDIEIEPFFNTGAYVPWVRSSHWPQEWRWIDLFNTTCSSCWNWYLPTHKDIMMQWILLYHIRMKESKEIRWRVVHSGQDREESIDRFNEFSSSSGKSHCCSLLSDLLLLTSSQWSEKKTNWKQHATFVKVNLNQIWLASSEVILSLSPSKVDMQVKPNDIDAIRQNIRDEDMFVYFTNRSFVRSRCPSVITLKTNDNH